MKDNETIAQIRRIRREISRRVAFDATRRMEFCKGRQKAHTTRAPAKPDR